MQQTIIRAVLGTLITLAFTGHAFSQTDVTLFYTADWRVTEEGKHAYYRICQYDLNNFDLTGEVKDYDKQGKLLMEGAYKSGKREGVFTFYYPNGTVRAKGSYVGVRRVGEWQYFYENGALYQLVDFVFADNPSYYKILELHDPEGKALVKNGNGTYEVVLENFNPIGNHADGPKALEGKVKNGLKTGSWKMREQKSGILLLEETWVNGVFDQAKVYHQDGSFYGTMKMEIGHKVPDLFYKKLHDTELFELDTTVFDESLQSAGVSEILETVTGQTFEIMNRPAGYGAGDYALLELIGKEIRYPSEALTYGQQGTVYLKVSIDAAGNPTQVGVLKSVAPSLDEEALRVVNLIDQWLPKIIEGEAVASEVTVPVKFKMN